jgi:hypothetical protein
MTLDEITAWLRAHPVPYIQAMPLPKIAFAFIDDPVSVQFDPAKAAVEEATVALGSLMLLPQSVRNEIEPHLYAFYRKEIEDGAGNFDTPQEQLDWEAGFTRNFVSPRHATGPGEVWPLVRFSSLRFQSGNGRIVASLWADAAWDGEHGCALHFDGNGRFLGVTNLNASPR